jgi:hypothetical protein
MKSVIHTHCVEQVHLSSFGNPPQVIQVQKFVTLFVTIRGRSHGKMGVSQGIEERMRVPFFKQENEETPISIPYKQQ